MTPTHRLPLLFLLILGGLSACPDSQTAPPGPIKSLGPLGSMQSAMVCTSGACAQDTNPAHAAVVFITMYMSNGQASCSGTLAASNVVITAGHCVSQENSSALISANNIDVYFGNSCEQCMNGSCSCTHSAVTAVHRHPSYDYTGPLNDVSVLIIASKPSSVTPIPMLPYASAGSIAQGTTVEFSGFGVDNSLQNSGVKLHATNTLNGVCNSSNGCGSMSGIPIEPWVIWYDENPGGPCSGDSGGPAFWKDGTGKEYVIAATSYGDQHCQYMGTSTFLPHFANPSGDNFLLSYVGAGFANGHACTGAADCTSGFCVNTVCCDTACNQGCQACSVAAGGNTNGTCTAANNIACDDLNPCTLNDKCVAGTCQGTPKDCGTSGGTACKIGGSCNLATGACQGGNSAPDGTACDDGNACTQGDKCQGGVCQPGVAVNSCPSPDPCKDASTCNASTGQCNPFPAKADGTACTDNNPCTSGDRCLSGSCTPLSMKSCPAPDVCHLTGTCDSGTGACGSYPNAPDGTSCNDNNACTSNDRCQAGVCKGTPTSVACPATACNTGGTCNAATGKCDGTNRPDGTVCDDGDANTLNDHCVGGICKGTPRGVDPCYGQSDGTYCDDGDACTRSDFCLSGKCTGTNPKICAAAQQCQKPGQCDWQTGECVYPAKTNGTTCDDGNPNTTNDRCSNSKCIGDAVTVPDECQGKADGTACVGGTCKAGTCDTTVVPGNCGCGSTAGAGPASALLFAVGAMALVRRRRRN